jgi:hypothetical protein
MNHAKTSDMSGLKWANVILRGLMETAVVAGLAYCGYKSGNQAFWKISLAVLFPVIGFGFWGIVDFHRLKKHAETLRLVQELLITGLIAAALIALGARTAGWILVALSVLHHSLNYLLGERLLKGRN